MPVVIKPSSSATIRHIISGKDVTKADFMSCLRSHCVVPKGALDDPNRIGTVNEREVSKAYENMLAGKTSYMIFGKDVLSIRSK